MNYRLIASLFGVCVFAAAISTAVFFVGCSTTQTDLSNFNKNLLTVVCSNPQGALANIPEMFVTPAQAQEALVGLCSAVFGPAQPTIPAVPAPAASPAAYYPPAAPLIVTNKAAGGMVLYKVQ